MGRDRSAQLLDDAVRDRQSESGPLAHLLRGEERVEDTRQRVRRNAGAAITDCDADAIASERRGDRNAARPRSVFDDGVFRVDEDVQHGLLQQQRVAKYGRQRFGGPIDDGLDFMALAARGGCRDAASASIV